MKTTSCETYVMEKVSVLIPKHMKVTQTSPVEDFEIYKFNISEKGVLTVYVGNQPSFPPKTNEKLEQSEISLNGLKAQTVAWKTAPDLVNKEVLIHVGQDGWPNVVHFYYYKLSKQESEIADGIIQSVKLIKKE